ncbi:hypothetical protein F5Y15DRAFT_260205 [Xylariaceae sp. FL0016]|nr:hypothetical protein F5Y15DRAFT_260205 [Xylariaceae sp. FL0016]
MAAITTLPLELLQQIAAWCTAPDILRLSQTCRTLHLACHDATVYQQSFELHVPNPTSASFCDATNLVNFLKQYVEGPRRPCQRNDGATKTWLCLAVAAVRIPIAGLELERMVSSVKLHATLESRNLGDDTKESFRGVIGLLATLPVWGYTKTCNASIAASLDSLCPILFSTASPMQPLRIDRSLGHEFALQFSFCLALSGLQSDNWNQPILGSTATGDPRIPLGPGTDALQAVIKAVFEGERAVPGYSAFQGTWAGKQTHALLLAILITRNLQYVSRNGAPGILGWILGLTTAGTGRRVQARVPNPSRIKFFSSWYTSNHQESSGDHDEHHLWVNDASLRPRFPLLNPSLVTYRGNMNDKGRYFYPFAGDDWWSWYTTRVRDIADTIDSGEWYGYYTYGISLAGHIDGPMERIRFQTNRDSVSGLQVEAADCVDAIGGFALKGEISTSNNIGYVRLVKRYEFHRFLWLGTITPLGILGAWYHPTRTQVATGYFWLWKSEWMDDETL